MKKNPDYVLADHIKLDEYVYKVVADRNTALELYLNGELDEVALSPEAIEQYVDDPSIKVAPATSIQTITINHGNTNNNGILGNLNFRKALFYAVDRQSIAKMTNGIPANYLVASKCLGLDGKTFREMPESQEYLTENLGYDPKLAKEYYDGNGINEQHTYLSATNNKGDSLIAEDENFAVVYNGSVGGTYEVMLKFTDQEIRDHIRRYGVDIAGETIKEVAREMAVEQFSALAHQKIPAFEMPNGDVLYVEYNKESDTLDVGQPTNAGLVAQHRFPYDHNIGLDANLQAVNEKLNELEEYRAELQEAEYGGGMRR